MTRNKLTGTYIVMIELESSQEQYKVSRVSNFFINTEPSYEYECKVQYVVAVPGVSFKDALQKESQSKV